MGGAAVGGGDMSFLILTCQRVLMILVLIRN